MKNGTPHPPWKGLSGLRQTGRCVWSRRPPGHKTEEVLPTLKKALSIPKPVIIDFVVDREENVYPMVPAGEPCTR